MPLEIPGAVEGPIFSGLKASVKRSGSSAKRQPKTAD